jgi:hypothetical protein
MLPVLISYPRGWARGLSSAVNLSDSPEKSMRHFLVALLLLFAAPILARADNRQYAVLSLVGDELLIVQREMSTGSRLDKNTRRTVAVPSGTLDRAVLLAIDDALRGADPAARPVLLATRDPSLYAVARRALDEGGTLRVFEAVRPVVAGARATHLILVTRHRHAAMLRLTGGHVGSGYLEGMGFYIDQGTGNTAYSATDAERGFISAFAYFKASVIDLARGTVVAEDYAIGSNAHARAAGQIGNAWSALTEEEKDRELTQLIREETAVMIPKLVGMS